MGLYLSKEDGQEFVELGWLSVEDEGVSQEFGFTIFPAAEWITTMHCPVEDMLPLGNYVIIKPEDVWALKLMDSNLWDTYLKPLKEKQCLSIKQWQ